MSKKIMTIKIEILSVAEVKGATGEILMIQFSGVTDDELFRGRVEQSGTDTQIQYYGNIRTLSARYILSGTDAKGNPCHIFIENNGVISGNQDPIKTVPKIITDSPELAWLETAQLSGDIEETSEGLMVHIYAETD